MTRFGAIEAGGTKFVCAVGSGPDDIEATTRFATTTPDATLHRAITFFEEQPPLDAVGIASFGPVDLNRSSSSYGHITSTPKPDWQNVDIVGAVKSALGVPVGFDTDVNGAALGEHRWGAAQGLQTFVYLTIGTGIGGGGMMEGQLMHGLVHPEMGHIRIPHDTERDPFPGICPYHNDCLEGLATGPAVEQRWGRPGEELPADHPAWPLEAHYLALGLMNIILMLSPQRIILGGGIMHQEQIFPMIRQEVRALLNGYVQASAILEEIDRYIVPPTLGNEAGMLGALALAKRAV